MRRKAVLHPASGFIRIAVLAASGLTVLSAHPVAATPAGDAAPGERVYARCTGCHSPDRNRTGPRHCDVVGRISGTASGYDYSAAMRNAAIVWDADALDRFLASPMTTVPGTTMGFAGVADAGERRDLIAYLTRLTASSDECRNSAPRTKEGDSK